MIFSSYTFCFVFLPIVLIGYALCARLNWRTGTIGWLVGCSLVFYGWWDYRYLSLLGGSILGNYLLGLAIANLPDGGRRRSLLALGVAFNLALLGYFKYAGFFLDTFAAMARGGFSIGAIALPLAISFFTFQQIAYLVDTYRRETEESNFLNYCLFVTFFPQLISGPIVHHREMLSQFRRRHFGLRARHLSVGLSIFTIGLAKKVLVADELSPHVSNWFAIAETGQALTFAQAWLAAVGFVIQGYFDFSGYSDMAIGLGRLFGIRLPLNFNSPYKATSIIDFWRRWHMTLSRFLRDYLYFPLGGNRRGKLRRYINLMVTMLLGGLWHGAGWTFLLWGGLQGLYLVVNHAWRALRGTSRAPSAIERTLMHGLTFVAIVVSFVLFRATTFDGAISVISSMFGFNGLALGGSGVHASRAAFLVLMLAIVFFMPNTQQVLRAQRPALGRRPRWTGSRLAGWFQWRPDGAWAMMLGALSVWCLLCIADSGEFIYYQF